MQLSVFESIGLSPCPEYFNMAAHTLGHRKTPDKIALEVIQSPGDISEKMTFAALRKNVLSVAGGLRLKGVIKGDRVVLLIGNRSDFPVLFFALNALGAVPVPLSIMLTPSEIRYVLAQLDPRMICADKPVSGTTCPQIFGTEIQALRLSQPINFVKTMADDPAYIVFTSGTGSKPKCVVHAQRAAWARQMMWDGWYGLKASDRVLHAGAFNWTYTLGAGLTDPWAIGATALIYTGAKSKTVWAKIAAKHKPSIFAATPGIYRQILSETGDLAVKFKSLRHCLSAGEALPVNIAQNWQTRVKKPIFEAFGMSEISTFVSHSPNTPPRKGTSGKPQKGRCVAILDTNNTPVPIGEPGFLAVHQNDPGLMIGYLNRPKQTGDWFVTGDRASMDKDAYITYLGRDDDMLNAGGYRVSALEIVNTLLTLPAVEDCAALELVIKKDTRVVAAFYSGNHTCETVLKNHCAQTLADYKCPRVFIHLDKLPRSENGKLLKRVLREKYDWKDHDNA